MLGEHGGAHTPGMSGLCRYCSDLFRFCSRFTILNENCDLVSRSQCRRCHPLNRLNVVVLKGYSNHSQLSNSWTSQNTAWTVVSTKILTMDTEHSTDERQIGVHPPAAALNNEHSPAIRFGHYWLFSRYSSFKHIRGGRTVKKQETPLLLHCALRVLPVVQ